jgi:hypothetical protein
MLLTQISRRDPMQTEFARSILIGMHRSSRGSLISDPEGGKIMERRVMTGHQKAAKRLSGEKNPHRIPAIPDRRASNHSIVFGQVDAAGCIKMVVRGSTGPSDLA